MIIPGIFELFVSFASIKNLLKEYTAQNSKTSIRQTFQLTSVAQERQLLMFGNVGLRKNVLKTSATVISFPSDKDQ